jgi:hypothetical protein
MFELLCAQQQVIGIKMNRRFMSQAFDLGELKLWFDRRNRAFGEPILQFEYAAQFAVEAIRPDVRPRRGVDELAGEAQAIAVAANAALDHIPHAKFAPDLAHVYGPTRRPCGNRTEAASGDATDTLALGRRNDCARKARGGSGKSRATNAQAGAFQWVKVPGAASSIVLPRAMLVFFAFSSKCAYETDERRE